MSQSFLFLAIQLLGLAVCMAVGPRRTPVLSCALAFPIGLAVTCLLALAMLICRVPYSPWSLGAAMAATAAAATIATARRGAHRRDLRVAGWWTLAFAIVCPALSHFNVAILTNDSDTILATSFSIASAGRLTPENMFWLDGFGVFQVLAHSMFGFTGREFLYALPLVLGLSFIPMFAVSLWHALDAAGAAARRRSWLVALVTAALFTLSMVDYHVVYIHTNLGSAIYLFGFLALFWIAEIRSDTTWLPPAFICLIAFALHRTETPLVALLFLALTVTGSDLPRRATTGWLAAFTASMVLWYEFLAQNIVGKDFLTPARSRLLWVLAMLFFLWRLASRIRFVRLVDRWVPAIIGGLCMLALIAAFAAKPDHMTTSAAHWAKNLTELPLWGHSWFLIPLLIAIGLAIEPPPFRQPFVVGLTVYAAVILLLSFSLPNPWRLGVGDSANRMTIHLLPSIFFYLALKFIPPLQRDAAPPSAIDGGRASRPAETPPASV